MPFLFLMTMTYACINVNAMDAQTTSLSDVAIDLLDMGNSQLQPGNLSYKIISENN